MPTVDFLQLVQWGQYLVVRAVSGAGKGNRVIGARERLVYRKFSTWQVPDNSLYTEDNTSASDLSQAATESRNAPRSKL